MLSETQIAVPEAITLKELQLPQLRQQLILEDQHLEIKPHQQLLQLQLLVPRLITESQEEEETKTDKHHITNLL
jgi:hypothetical protein